MKRWLAYLSVGALLLGGLLVAAFHAPIWYDDAGHYLVARAIASGDGMCYPLDSDGANCVENSPFITMGPVQAYPLGAWLRLVGDTMLAGRIFMVLVSLGAAFALYRLGRALTTSTKASIAVALMALNIQFLTYGAEVLGEMPMMGLVLAGISCFLRWDRGHGWWWAVLGIVAWCLAVGIKEYAMLPLAMSLVVWLALKGFSKDRPLAVLYLGVGFGIGLGLTVAWLAIPHGGLVAHLLDRQSYRSEFLALDLGTSLKYLLFKPLFWLGTGAMVLKWRVQRRPAEALTLSVQAAWLVFFLLSAGYDRFGFLLLFLPAVYVAEFVPYLWQEAGRQPRWAWLRRATLVVVAWVVFSQQTYWVFGQRILHPDLVNAVERAATARLRERPAGRVVTVEQQMALFLDAVGQRWRLYSRVPSQGRGCDHPDPELRLALDEVLLAGPYAFTEYDKCIDWTHLEAIDSVQVGAERWVFYAERAMNNE